MAWPDELGGKPVDLIRAENQDPIMVFASKGVPIYEREPERRFEGERPVLIVSPSVEVKSMF